MGYKVTDMFQVTNIVQGGRVQRAWRITALTTMGVQFQEDVPDEEFTDNAVNLRLTTRAAHIDAIRNLGA